MTTHFINQEFISKKYKEFLQMIDEDLIPINFQDLQKSVRKMLDNNVMDGKNIRCSMMIETVKIFNKIDDNRIETNYILEKAVILGLVLEFILALSSVIDDVMFHSLSRSGKISWFIEVCIVEG